MSWKHKASVIRSHGEEKGAGFVDKVAFELSLESASWVLMGGEAAAHGRTGTEAGSRKCWPHARLVPLHWCVALSTVHGSSYRARRGTSSFLVLLQSCYGQLS